MAIQASYSTALLRKKPDSQVREPCIFKEGLRNSQRYTKYMIIQC